MKWYFVKLVVQDSFGYICSKGTGITGDFSQSDLSSRLSDAIGWRNTFEHFLGPKWGIVEIWSIDFKKNKLEKVKL